MPQTNLIDLETEILSYWEKHPSAKDTVEGIVRFWLPLHGRTATLSDVQEVLRRLVEKNQLSIVDAGAESESVYKLTRATG